MHLLHYLLWFDKDKNNVIFRIDSIYIGDEKLKLKDAYLRVKDTVKHGHKLYRKINVKADKEIQLLAVCKMPDGV